MFQICTRGFALNVFPLIEISVKYTGFSVFQICTRSLALNVFPLIEISVKYTGFSVFQICTRSFALNVFPLIEISVKYTGFYLFVGQRQTVSTFLYDVLIIFNGLKVCVYIFLSKFAVLPCFLYEIFHVDGGSRYTAFCFYLNVHVGSPLRVGFLTFEKVFLTEQCQKFSDRFLT